MMRLRAGALAIDLRPGIGAVELNVFDPAAPQDVDAALGIAAVFQFDEDLVLDLHVPGIVVLAGLDHRARRRHRVAPALHFDRVEIGPVGYMVRGIALALDEITGLEVDKPVGTGSHRLEIRWRFT